MAIDLVCVAFLQKAYLCVSGENVPEACNTFSELISAQQIFQVHRKWRHVNFSVSMNMSSSAPFQEERSGLGLYPPGGGSCTCKNSDGDARPIFWV